MKKRHFAPAALAATALVVTACGSGDNGGGDDDDVDFGSSLTIWADETRTPILQEYTEKFQEEYGVNVTIQEHADELRETYVTATEQGQGPDILVGAHDWAGELARDGMVSPLQLTDSQREQFDPSTLDAFTIDGNAYAVPYATENIALIRNTDLAPDAPETFEEMIEVGQDLVDAGEVDHPLAIPVSTNGDPYHGFPLFSSFGGYLFGTDDEGNFDTTDIGIDSPGGIAAFEKFAQLGEEGILTTSMGGDNTIPFFAEGDAPFLISGPWALGDAAAGGINYEVSAIPGFEGEGPAAPFLGVQGFYLSSKAENEVFAMEFLTNFVIDEELQLLLAEAGGRLPAHTGAAEAFAADNPDLEGFAAAGEFAIPMPNIPEMNAIWEPFGRAQANAIDASVDGDEAASTAADAIRSELE
ncbi:sugar ABC transporter substrate-binding protein [Natronoglycomyces albus]|uniref:Maltose ABC transporter substrate-binding protein n=1 Tax=Natronoglycomyces albus TaxID=2811108 RepID=A0A895XEL2_9ACTN|nr:maltose ABC transporter substrate-binding protein [Natronoglycomyces albus]QSB04271.1 maltose ABC transporter substrate-binding protein [Natronoglycomyces albus]